MKTYEIDSGDFKDCKRNGATIVKAVCLSDVLLMLYDLRHNSKIYGEKHTGLGLIRSEINLQIRALKGGYDDKR